MVYLRRNYPIKPDIHMQQLNLRTGECPLLSVQTIQFIGFLCVNAMSALFLMHCVRHFERSFDLR